MTSIAVLAVSLSLIAAPFLYALNQYPLEMWQQSNNQRIAQRVAAGLTYNERGMPVSAMVDEQTAWLFDVAPTEVMYRVFDNAGGIILSAGKDHDGHPWGKVRLAELAGTHQQVSINGQPFDMATLEVLHQGRLFYVQTATSNAFGDTVVDMKFGPLPEMIAVSILIATIAFGLAFPFTIRRVLHPLKVASDAATSITPANLQTRLSDQHVPSEIKPLIVAFNDALARLEKGFTAQQEFLGAAAHELQTPLTLLRGQIELQTEIENKDLLYRDIDLMARQVRQLLHLAEVSESQNYSFGEIDRIAVVRDVLAYLERKAGGNQITLRLQAPDTLPLLYADKSALFILLKNIVENAIHYTPAGGTVFVVADHTSVQVTDSGPGIKPGELPLVFDRFWRAPDAVQGGTGLGLAICREIAVAHRWRLSVEALRPGTRFILWF
ncbi:HAMP domain-containing sensor histidine kinase [Acerihabitans arboris]|uniref:HAMP domain-containing sensor histidine kinase n=1 Tax=Acerihabitans arboris TaxID=2691583 RepID=UPI001FE92183|nr:HAMP domain-containing sensor histidine kinase [Acerihabitans arboris]